MITILSALVSLLSFRVRSRISLELELVALRHQVAVLQRQRKGQLRLFFTDRLLWVWLYRAWPQVLHAMVLVKPTTVIQWHRKGFRLYWRWRSRRLGRPKMGTEIRDLIRQMSLANPLWGAPRIHGELLKLGIQVSQATVGRYMPWRPKLPSPAWRSFLHNHLTEIAAIDMFVVATATFRLLYTLIVLSHERRRVIHFDVTQYPTQDWRARQITEAFPWDTAPGYLLRDRDTSYGAGFRDRVRVMGIEEVVTAPRSPWQNPYVERLIGSIRRECLDHIIIFNEHHLPGVLSSYFQYYHKSKHICRSTRIARRRAQYTRQPLARSLPSRRSVVCIIATNDALHELLGRSNRRTRFGARGRPALRCIAQMQWRPKPMHVARIAAAANVLFDRIFVGKPIPKLDRFLGRDRPQPPLALHILPSPSHSTAIPSHGWKRYLTWSTESDGHSRQVPCVTE